MDAHFTIIGMPAVGLFISLLAIVFCAMLALYASTWSQEYSQELSSKGVYELPTAMGFMWLATSVALLVTYSFLWAVIAAVASWVVVAKIFLALDRRRREHL